MQDEVFAKSLREALARAGITPSVLAMELGVSRAIVYRWLSGALPSHRHARALEARLGLLNPGLSSLAAIALPSTAHRVPLLRKPPSPDEQGQGSDNAVEKLVEVDNEFSPEAFGLRVANDAMEPEFREGEIVIVDPQVRPSDGDYLVVELQDTQERTGTIWMLNQYRPRGFHRERRVFDLVPLNPAYRTITVTPDLSARMIGVVVEHRRRFRSRDN